MFEFILVWLLQMKIFKHSLNIVLNTGDQKTSYLLSFNVIIQNVILQPVYTYISYTPLTTLQKEPELIKQTSIQIKN